jgi:hypothetical protein
MAKIKKKLNQTDLVCDLGIWYSNILFNIKNVNDTLLMLANS